MKKASFVFDFYRDWGFLPICGGDGTGDGDGNGDGDKGEGDSGAKKEALFDWGGKKLTATEMHEEAKNLFSENTRAKQLLNDPDKLAKYIDETFKQADDDNTGNKPVNKDAHTAQVIAELREMGVVFNEDTKAVLDKFKDDEFFRDQREIVKEELRVENRIESLITEIDGKDGRPAFKAPDVISYLREHGFVGERVTKEILSDAYEKINAKELAAWRAEKGKDKPKAPYTERSGGGGNKKPDKEPQKISFDGGEDSMSVGEAVAALMNTEE